MRVTVVGGGVAGTAAAIAAAQGGAKVTLVAGGSGASMLSSGALDLRAWEEDDAREALGLESGALDVLKALDAYVLPDHGVLLVTVAGIVRASRGADRALLDVSRLSSATVLVPRFDHPSWDGVALARAWTDAPAARARAITFVPAPLQITRFVEERSLVDAELAARHDEEGRLAWLAAQLVEAVAQASTKPAAVALPAWLGVERSRAEALSAKVGVPCGEAIVGTGGPSGLRFDRASQRALAAANVEIVRGRVTRASHEADGWRAELEDGGTVGGDAIVLASGGLIGGGIEYTPGGSVLAAALPPSARPIVRSTIAAPLRFGARGQRLELPGSLFGAPAESLSWPFVLDSLLERAGVLVDAEMRACGAERGLFAAGELVADRPRTWLDALATGSRAGAFAARA